MSEITKRCQVEKQNGKPCGRELYDGECCIFHSKKEDKDEKLFQKGLNEIFRDKSLETYDFSSFVFPGKSHFPVAINKPVTFSKAVFLGTVAFWSVNFNYSCNFSQAVFEGDVLFAHSPFVQGVDFSYATFRGQAMFVHNECGGETSFVHATFEDALIISPGIEYYGKTFNVPVDFRYVTLLKPEKVRFYKVDLRKFRFFETDLQRVHFIDVDWNEERGRYKLLDEMSPETLYSDYPLVALLYRRLRANYESSLRYSEAGNFYIGEMEMTIKAQNSIFKKLPLLFYKAISNYGESYYRPLCWLVIFLVVIFPALFMITGLHSINSAESNLPPFVIDYKWDFSSIESFLPNVQKLKDYGTSFLYTMSVFSLVRDKKYTTVNNWGHTLFVAESLLTPVFLAFFLLALRRRFKR